MSVAGKVVVTADGRHYSAAHTQPSRGRLPSRKQHRWGNRLEMRYNAPGEMERRNDQEGGSADF